MKRSIFLLIAFILLTSFVVYTKTINGNSSKEGASNPAQVYHFTQPNAGIPQIVLNPSQSQINKFQAIAWRTRTKFVTAQNNYVETTINTYCAESDNAPNGIVTVQFQNNWGGTNRSLGVNAWNSSLYGNNAKVSFGAMISIPYFTPPFNTTLSQFCCYADFYLRGYDKVSQKSYWIQFAFFDSRGMPGDSFYKDSFTSEWMLVGTLRNSAYMSMAPSSNNFTSSFFLPPLRFFGATISRSQMIAILTQLKPKIGGNFSTNPDDQRIFAFGCTPEIANGKTGGCMNFRMNNLFLRTEH